MNQGILTMVGNSQNIEAFGLGGMSDGSVISAGIKCVYRIRNEGPEVIFVAPDATGGEPAFPIDPSNKDVVLTFSNPRLRVTCPTSDETCPTLVRYMVTH